MEEDTRWDGKEGDEVEEVVEELDADVVVVEVEMVALADVSVEEDEEEKEEVEVTDVRVEVLEGEESKAVDGGSGSGSRMPSQTVLNEMPLDDTPSSAFTCSAAMKGSYSTLVGIFCLLSKHPTHNGRLSIIGESPGASNPSSDRKTVR